MPVVVALFLGVQASPTRAQTEGYPLPIPLPSPSGPVTLIPPTPSGSPSAAAPTIPGGPGQPVLEGPTTPGEGIGRLPGRRLRLELNRRAVRPGEAVVARGGGCAAFDEVTFRVDERALGSARADSSGDFHVILSFPALAPGRHRVVALCGDVIAEAQIDVVVTTTGSTVALIAASVVVLCFLVLLGALLSEGRGIRRPVASHRS